MSAVLNIIAGRYFAAIVFVYGEADRDFLGAAWRDKGDGGFTISGRIRFYVDGEAAHSADVKKHIPDMVFSADATEADVVKALRALAEGLVSDGFNDMIDLLEPRTDDPRAVGAALLARPWSHVKTMSGAKGST